MGVNTRIVFAVVIGLSLVGGTFWWRQNHLSGPEEANSITKQKAVRNFIPVNDSDDNGIPDWQEVFADGTINLDEVGAASTSTRTSQLVASIGTYLMSGQGTPEQALNMFGTELATEAIDVQYTEKDIRIGTDDSQAAKRAYGNNVALIARSYPLPAGTPDEMAVLNEAFAKNDPVVLQKLDPTVAAYRGMRDDMLALVVPPSLVREHLSLINVYNAVLIDIESFRNLYTDALTALLRFRRYPADGSALYTAISNLYLKLDQSGIQWNDSDAAAKFIQVE